MTDRPDPELIRVRTDALSIAAMATAPLDGLQLQLEVINFAAYLEAWILRPAERTEDYEDAHAEMEAELNRTPRPRPAAAVVDVAVPGVTE